MVSQLECDLPSISPLADWSSYCRWCAEWPISRYLLKIEHHGRVLRIVISLWVVVTARKWIKITHHGICICNLSPWIICDPRRNPVSDIVWSVVDSNAVLWRTGLNSLGPVRAMQSICSRRCNSIVLRNIEVCDQCICLQSCKCDPFALQAAASGLRHVSCYTSDDNTAEYLRDYFLEGG